MGQIISSADMRGVVDANLKSYIAQATEHYARLFNKSPTFVTYYAQNYDSSYADVNLGGAIQLIGPESPIKYTVIKDFPIYGVSEADVSAAYDELKGIVSDSIRGDAFILPGTIEPSENDYFVINFLDTKLVFRAISANPDRIEGHSFFKVTYSLDPANLEDLAKQVDGSYIFELATIGTGANPLIEADTAVVLREMEVLINSHKDSYWRAFYDRSSGVLMMKAEELPIHDYAVNLCIKRNDLLSTSAYLKSKVVFIDTASDDGLFADCIYPQTIYGCAETGVMRDDVMRKLRINKVRPTSPASQFFAAYALDSYCEALPDRIAQRSLGSDEFWQQLDTNFVSSIPIVSLAARCIKADGFSNDLPTAIDEFNSLINNSDILMNRPLYYWLMPLILMRAKRFQQEARKTSD
jgi:hypothetical protein